MTSRTLSIYLVADPDHCVGDVTATVKSAIAGGVSCVQLRAKSLTDREHLALARQLRTVCQDSGTPFLVNDRLDIALLAGADGVHLGVDDLPPLDVRRHVPENFIVGFSPDHDDQIRQASTNGIDYLGVGPVFGTATKLDAGQALGIHEFARRCSLSPVPVVGIGGINARNALDVRNAGAAGVAVVSAILGASDPSAAAAEFPD